MNDLPVGHIRKFYLARPEMVLQFTNHPVPSIRRRFFGVVGGGPVTGQDQQAACAARCRRSSCSKVLGNYYTRKNAGIQPFAWKFAKSVTFCAKKTADARLPAWKRGADDPQESRLPMANQKADPPLGEKPGSPTPSCARGGRRWIRGERT
jgi:hypothetical protein